MTRKFYLWLVIVLLVGWLIYGRGEDEVTTGPNNITQTASMIQDSPADVEYVASFEIYTRGTKRIFTDSKYHELNKDIFITAKNPEQIMIKRAGIKWRDFFATLPMSVTSECLTTGTGQKFCSNEREKLKFLLNGVEQEVLNLVIQAGDHLVIQYEAD